MRSTSILVCCAAVHSPAAIKELTKTQVTTVAFRENNMADPPYAPLTIPSPITHWSDWQSRSFIVLCNLRAGSKGHMTLPCPPRSGITRTIVLLVQEDDAGSARRKGGCDSLAVHFRR